MLTVRRSSQNLSFLRRQESIRVLSLTFADAEWIHAWVGMTRTCIHAVALNAVLVRFSGAPSVQATSSSMRIPPKGLSRSTCAH